MTRNLAMVVLSSALTLGGCGEKYALHTVPYKGCVADRIEQQCDYEISACGAGCNDSYDCSGETVIVTPARYSESGERFSTNYASDATATVWGSPGSSTVEDICGDLIIKTDYVK